MILYVNGDSHSGGCEAMSPDCFLEDNWPHYSKNIDPTLLAIWRDEIKCAPTPENINVSYGKIVADKLGAELHCHARAAGSNDRIIRTTREYLENFAPDLIIIGWSTWEREEWYNEENNTWYQVNASGTDHVPAKWKDRYKNFVINIDWPKKIKEAHEKIWALHQDLKNKNIPHLFFNCHLSLRGIRKYPDSIVKDWGFNYIHPYSLTFSYGEYLIKQGHDPTKCYHFGPDAHRKWAEFLLPWLTRLL